MPAIHRIEAKESSKESAIRDLLFSADDATRLDRACVCFVFLVYKDTYTILMILDIQYFFFFPLLYTKMIIAF